jgi:hypothetical protein
VDRTSQHQRVIAEAIGESREQQQHEARGGQAPAKLADARPNGKPYEQQAANQEERIRDKTRQRTKVDPPKIQIESPDTEVACEVEKGECA